MMSFCRPRGGDLRGAMLFMMCVCVCAGVYTAYKPYLSRDEEIIKQLQKVRQPRLSVCLPAWKYVLQLGA